MSIVKDFKVEDRLEGKVLVVYIKPYFVELATEGDDIAANPSLREEIYRILNRKLKNSKVVMCKIMLGGLLIGTIYSSNLPVAAAGADTSIRNTVEYRVKSGDTLWKISQRYGVTVEELQALNNLSHSTIYVDQLLNVPSNDQQEYVVESGDTLYKIANNFNTSVDAIKSLNHLNSDMIYEGQTLIISNEKINNTESTYIVKANDTLWKIASQNNMSVDTLKVINDLKGDTIYIGQVLKLNNVPEDRIDYINYTVVSGDTQWSIAIEHGIPVNELQETNNINDNTSLSIGQVLKIPVHTVAVMSTNGAQFGEYQDWWEGARYIFPINEEATVKDFETGQTFRIKRTIGANHADCEPLTSNDSAIIKDLWGGNYSWKTRPVLIQVNGRQIAASMSSMPHSIDYIEGNNFEGHFDIHFKNSTRHVDGQIDPYHQSAIKIAAGIQ